MKAYLSIVWVALWVTNAIADSPEREYAIAAQYYADENWDLAATAFGDLTQQHSDSPQAVDAAFYAGESLVQLNRYDDAAEYFQRFLEAAPEHESRAQAFFRSGECAYLANRPIAALRQLREFNRLYPEHELQQYALPYLGSLSRTASDQEGAIQAFSGALKVLYGFSRSVYPSRRGCIWRCAPHRVRCQLLTVQDLEVVSVLFRAFRLAFTVFQGVRMAWAMLEPFRTAPVR